MIQQHFALLTFAICFLAVSAFAQKNTTIQPQVKQVKTVEQPQSTVIMHTAKKEITPLYQQVTKSETDAQNKQTNQPKLAAQPSFGSVARPNIYKNIDANIEALEQKITNIEADSNHDESTLIKYRATLERLKEIKAEKPDNQ